MIKAKNNARRFVIAGAMAFAAFVFISGIAVYRFQWQSRAAYAVARVIPYPAILVDWEIIPLHTYLSDLAALYRYWDFQRENKNVLLGIPDPQEIRERLVNKLIAEKVVRIFARKQRITVADQEVYLEWERLRERPESQEEIHAFVQEAYGWNDDQFIERVLRPFLLQQKVKTALLSEFGKSDEELEQQALSLVVLAREEGADFAQLAREESYDAATAHQGGDLGYFGRGALEPALEQAIFGMEIGEVSDPVKSSYGWHIIKLEDVLYDENRVAQKARARHILVRGFDFDEWVEQQKRELAIFRLVR
ncbi:MAG: peptidylprolyl isomerase [Parcubacteria group bacterium]|nr:peptidylprolyl isomerase [Parcubacteria group bacterium]